MSTDIAIISRIMPQKTLDDEFSFEIFAFFSLSNVYGCLLNLDLFRIHGVIDEPI